MLLRSYTSLLSKIVLLFRDGFQDLAKKVVKLCGNLPLGLRVVGSSLCGESEDEWRLQLYGLETNLDRKIEDILRVGYDKLLEKHQFLFLHIACFFNKSKVDHVTTMLADSNLDVRNGLKTLVAKSLVHISTLGRIYMHNLVQQLGRHIVLKQSNEPGKRQFLVQVEDIRDLLENETGTGSVLGISSDMSKIGEFSISGRAFEGMRNLKYLRFNNANVSLLEDMEYLPRLRVLHWPLYPRKCLPPTFQPERLVELHMPDSELERLWGGIQPLTNLKKIDLGYSLNLKEIPNLSKATNLETLIFTGCESLVDFPSSMSNLHKLEQLEASGCINLQVVSTNINLASLEEVNMMCCSRLRNLPNISRNIKTLRVGGSMMEDFPSSVVGDWSRLECLQIGSRSLTRLTHVPENVTTLDLSNSDIKTIPECVKGLPYLTRLIIFDCKKLVSIPRLSASLEWLLANHCVSLKRVCCSFGNQIRELDFYNCLNLDEEARRGIVQGWGYQYVCLPGKEVPADFTNRTKGSSITIPLAPGTISASTRVKVCLLLSPIKDEDMKYGTVHLTCCLRSKEGVQINSMEKFAWVSNLPPESPSDHLFIFCGDLVRKRKRRHEVEVTMSEIQFEFSCWEDGEKIIECGVQILREEAESSSGGNIEVGCSETGGNRDGRNDGNGDGDCEAEASKVSQVENVKKKSKQKSHWSWLRKLVVGKKKL